MGQAIIISDVGSEGGERQFNLEKDIPKLRDLMEEVGDVKLIVIDPVTNYLGGADLNNSGEVRAITTQLALLAQKHNACVLMLTHLNKGSDKQAIHRMLGSMAWVGAARTAFVIEKDSDDSESKRRLVPAKNNLAADDTGYAFRLEGVTVEGDIPAGFVAWEHQSFNGTAEQAFAAIKTEGGGEVLKEAKQLLLAHLVDTSTPAGTLVRLAEENGISERTLRSAKKDLGVLSTYDKTRNAYVWSLKADQ